MVVINTSVLKLILSKSQSKYENNWTYYVFTEKVNSALVRRKEFVVRLNSTLLFSFQQSVNLLAMRTRDVVKGNHTRKTASFIRVSELTNF